MPIPHEQIAQHTDESLAVEVQRQLKDSGISLSPGDRVDVVDDSVLAAIVTIAKRTGGVQREVRKLAGSVHQFKLGDDSPKLSFGEALGVLASVDEDVPKSVVPLRDAAMELIKSLTLGEGFAHRMKATRPDIWKAKSSLRPLRAFYGPQVTTLLKDSSDDVEMERFTLGVVLEITDGSDGHPVIPDTDGDIYGAQDVRDACHWWAEFGRQSGYLHGPRFGGFIMDPDDDRVVVLQSFITPVVIPAGTYSERQEKDVKVGTWLQGFRVNDPDIWSEVLSGDLDGLSIGGDALSTPVE